MNIIIFSGVRGEAPNASSSLALLDRRPPLTEERVVIIIMELNGIDKIQKFFCFFGLFRLWRRRLIEGNRN